MKKATLVMATFVAFLLSGPVFAARVFPTMPPIKDVVGATATIVGDGVKFTGSIFPSEFLGAPINKSLAVVEEATIASSAISGLARVVIAGGAAGVAAVAAGYAFDQMINGVGWVIGPGSVMTKQAPGSTVVTNPAAGEYYYTSGGSTKYSSVTDACLASATFASGVTSTSITSIAPNGSTNFNCSVHATRTNGTTFDVVVGVSAFGNHCPSGSSLSPYGSCVGTSITTPVVPSDLTVLDGFVKSQGGVWQRDLMNELCGGLEPCYEALSPTTNLNGPLTVTGTPQTVTTTSPSGTVSTTVKTPTTSITYGPNYYDTTTTTTTTNNNGGGTTTTTDDSTTTFPEIPNILGGANGGLGDINNGIPGTTSHTSPIPYMAWYSFSQSCSEITLVIPVYGGFQTALCPIYATYIWPILYFFFAVFTWHTCFDIWRKTVLRVRAS